jgi:glc operon protein GlcG
MKNKPILTLADAKKMLVSCQKAAEEKNWNVSIAVVDEGGYPICLERLDGAALPSAEIAILKARTAALSRVPTKALEAVAKDRPATTTFPGRLPVQGGVPILYQGSCVGGIGVSGVKSQEDEIVATAGLAALDSAAAYER